MCNLLKGYDDLRCQQKTLVGWYGMIALNVWTGTIISTMMKLLMQLLKFDGLVDNIKNGLLLPMLV